MGQGREETFEMATHGFSCRQQHPVSFSHTTSGQHSHHAVPSHLRAHAQHDTQAPCAPCVLHLFLRAMDWLTAVQGF
jgi:hypothetical protein